MGFFIVLFVVIYIWNKSLKELNDIHEEEKWEKKRKEDKYYRGIDPDYECDSRLFEESDKGDEFFDDELSDDESFYDSEDYDGWNS